MTTSTFMIDVHVVDGYSPVLFCSPRCFFDRDWWSVSMATTSGYVVGENSRRTISSTTS